MNRRTFNTLGLAIGAVLLNSNASNASSEKYKLINATALKSGKYSRGDSQKNLIDISTLKIVKLDLKGVSGESILLKSGKKRVAFNQWRREAKIPKNARNIMIAHHAKDFPGLKAADVARLESLKHNETASWTSGDTMVGTYGCTDYGYWCTRT